MKTPTNLAESHASGPVGRRRASMRPRVPGNVRGATRPRVIALRHGEPIADLVEDWLHSARRRGRSPETLALYSSVAHRILGPYCRAEGVEYVEDFSTRHFERMAGRLLDEGMKPVTVDTYMRTIGYFFSWAVKSGELAEAPKRPRVTVPKPELVPLDRAETDRLVEAAQNDRDRLVLELLTVTGIRASELCRLEVGDVARHGSRFFAHVHGKGARERLVPITPSLYRRVNTYVRGARPDADTRRLFVSIRRDYRTGDYAPLQRSGLLKIVKSAAARAGIERRAYTHLLRHSFGTRALEDGWGDILVARTMGHSDLRMLQTHYGHLTAQSAYDAMTRALARDREGYNR